MRGSISSFYGFLAIGLLTSSAPLGAEQAKTERLFKQLDANHDGLIDREEVGDPHARLFTRLLRTGVENFWPIPSRPGNFSDVSTPTATGISRWKKSLTSLPTGSSVSCSRPIATRMANLASRN